MQTSLDRIAAQSDVKEREFFLLNLKLILGVLKQPV